MGKVISNILLGLLTIALAIFTGSRTLDLIGQLLPANQQIYQWLALAAFEGGFALWCIYFIYAAEGQVQRGVAALMIVIDLLGIIIATLADLLMISAKDGKIAPITPDMQEAIIVAIGIVIVANVTAFAAAKLTHPEKLRGYAVQDAEDVIHAENLRAIRVSAPMIASQIAPLHQRQWAEQTWNKLLPGTGITYIQEESPKQQIEAPASFAQTASLPSAHIPVVDDKPKKGIIASIKDLFGTANDNQPHIDGGEVAQEVVSSSTAEQTVVEEKPKSNAGRRRNDKEIKEGIEYYRTTGNMPEGWTSKQMTGYIKRRYPNGLPTKHDSMEEN